MTCICDNIDTRNIYSRLSVCTVGDKVYDITKHNGFVRDVDWMELEVLQGSVSKSEDVDC